MTTEIKDGGPAFPCAADIRSGWYAEYGMTLRDWFAGQALSGALAHHQVRSDKATVCEAMYEFADAMLKAREGGAA